MTRRRSNERGGGGDDYGEKKNVDESGEAVAGTNDTSSSSSRIDAELFAAENEDWGATCAIYGSCCGSYSCSDAGDDQHGAMAEITVKKLPFGGYCGTLHRLPISVSNVAFARRVSPDEDLDLPRFRYWTYDNADCGESGDRPVLSVSFYYNQHPRDPSPDSVGVRFRHYPQSWPSDLERPYVEWLTTEATKVLHEEGKQSFAVCDYLEHRGLEYFKTAHSDEDNTGYSLIELPPIPEYHPNYSSKMEAHVATGTTTKTATGHYFNPRAIEFYNPIIKRPKAATSTKTGKADQVAATLEEYTRQTLAERWRYFVETKCPICFDAFSLGDGVELPPCGHYFCKDCISMYVQHVVEDGLSVHKKENPFKCPLPSCKTDIPIIGCVKKLLTEEQMAAVRSWYKDLKQPPCWSLDRCLSKNCNRRGTMRYVNNSSSNNRTGGGGDTLLFMQQQQQAVHVYCDSCGVTWCELCLKRVKGGDHEVSCDPATVIKFCLRYLAASDEVRAKCEDKYPWIAMYAKTKVQHHRSFEAWIKENGQVCPECSTGVERIEGCFHVSRFYHDSACDGWIHRALTLVQLVFRFWLHSRSLNNTDDMRIMRYPLLLRMR